MCLGDVRLMPWITARLVRPTITTSWTKILDADNSRAGILLANHDTTDYRVMFGANPPQDNSGFLVSATQPIRQLFKFDEIGRLVQFPLWARVNAGTATITVLELTTTPEIMHRIREGGLFKHGDTKL